MMTAKAPPLSCCWRFDFGGSTGKAQRLALLASERPNANELVRQLFNGRNVEIDLSEELSIVARKNNANDIRYLVENVSPGNHSGMRYRKQLMELVGRANADRHPAESQHQGSDGGSPRCDQLFGLGD